MDENDLNNELSLSNTSYSISGLLNTLTPSDASAKEAEDQKYGERWEKIRLVVSWTRNIMVQIEL